MDENVTIVFLDKENYGARSCFNLFFASYFNILLSWQALTILEGFVAVRVMLEVGIHYIFCGYPLYFVNKQVSYSLMSLDEISQNGGLLGGFILFPLS